MVVAGGVSTTVQMGMMMVLLLPLLMIMMMLKGLVMVGVLISGVDIACCGIVERHALGFNGIVVTSGGGSGSGSRTI